MGASRDPGSRDFAKAEEDRPPTLHNLAPWVEAIRSQEEGLLCGFWVWGRLGEVIQVDSLWPPQTARIGGPDC